jgi:hypothetical protein
MPLQAPRAVSALYSKLAKALFAPIRSERAETRIQAHPSCECLLNLAVVHKRLAEKYCREGNPIGGKSQEPRILQKTFILSFAEASNWHKGSRKAFRGKAKCFAVTRLERGMTKSNSL